MNIHRLLKAWNEYSFLWSILLKYLWKLITNYMKASFNIISKNQIFSQNVYSVKGACPLSLRNLHLRAWVNCRHQHWRSFFFEPSTTNDKDGVLYHWGVLPWTNYPWLGLDTTVSAGSQNQRLKSSDFTFQVSRQESLQLLL